MAVVVERKKNVYNVYNAELIELLVFRNSQPGNQEWQTWMV